MKRVACVFLLALAVRANADDVALHLVTWNVHGLFWPVAHHTTERMHNIARKVVALNPDIVMFQEVWFASRADALTHDLTAAGYTAVPIRRGGLLVFYKPSWTIDSPAFVKYKSIAPKIFFWQADGLSGKGFLTLAVTSPYGKRFVLIDTHLQSQYGRLFRWRKIRREELKQLDQVTSNDPIILAGDFNTFPDESMMQTFKQSWYELTEKTRQDCNCGSNWNGGKPADWIDYVFVRPSGAATATIELIKNDKSDWPFSDHEGLDSLLTIHVQ